MSTIENKSIWETVNTSIQEIERLLAQGKYNQVMVKSRQTVEYMVKSLADPACIIESDLAQMIDELFNGGWISKETREHYHQIRILGNKAVNEANNSATDANRCYQILAQEGHIFSHSSQRRRPSGSSRPSSVKRKKRKTGTDLLVAYALRVFIPLLLLIVVIFLATKLVKVFSGDKEPTSTSIETTSGLTIPANDETEETTENTGSDTSTGDSSVVLYRAITTVNVRPEPNTSIERIGKLSPNDTVEFIRDYDDMWIVVKYNGQEAYIAKQYLVPVAE